MFVLVHLWLCWFSIIFLNSKGHLCFFNSKFHGKADLHTLFTFNVVLSLSVSHSLPIKVCNSCKAWDKRDPDRASEAWKQWKEAHDEECYLNHVGSSRAMEADIAKALWMRSEEERQKRYTVFVGDGASFGRVVSLKPYGDTPVVKEDCTGHIQKRMGTKLREVKRKLQGQKLGDGKGIGGRQRLTTKRINSFQVSIGLTPYPNLPLPYSLASL